MANNKYSLASVQITRDDRKSLEDLRAALMRNGGALPDDLFQRLAGPQGRARSFSYADVLGVAIEFTRRAFGEPETPAMGRQVSPAASDEQVAGDIPTGARRSDAPRGYTPDEAEALIEARVQELREK